MPNWVPRSGLCPKPGVGITGTDPLEVSAVPPGLARGWGSGEPHVVRGGLGVLKAWS